MSAPIIPGAEPWSSPSGGPHGVLVLHGFTGNPQSMRTLAEAVAEAGFAVEMPLLPGHGTSVEDMIETGWDDWSTAAEAAYARISGRADKVVVAGLSMGGALTGWLGGRHPEAAGLVFINALATEPPGVRELVQTLLDAGDTTMDAIDTFRVQALDSMAATIGVLESEVAKSQTYLERVSTQDVRVGSGALSGSLIPVISAGWRLPPRSMLRQRLVAIR